MKKIITAVSVALLLAGCNSPTGTSATGTGINDSSYRFRYEFKNDRSKDVTLVFCRDFAVKSSVKDTKGKGYNLDSSMTTFDSVFIPVDSIVMIGSDNDTLMMSPQYLLDVYEGRFRAIEYGSGFRKLSNDEY